MTQQKARHLGEGAGQQKSQQHVAYSSTEAPIDRLLSRLDGVKQTGPGRWIARCPAHADMRPSLSIRETGDGRVLVHCFGGCPAEEILSAVGLTFADLFPEKLDGHCHHPERRPFPISDVFRSVLHEAMIVASCAASIRNGNFTDGDMERLVEAVSRIQAAAALAGVVP